MMRPCALTSSHHCVHCSSSCPALRQGPAALALEALGVLCQRGGLSFPDAWKLLQEGPPAAP